MGESEGYGATFWRLGRCHGGCEGFLKMGEKGLILIWSLSWRVRWWEVRFEDFLKIKILLFEDLGGVFKIRFDFYGQGDFFEYLRWLLNFQGRIFYF